MKWFQLFNSDKQALEAIPERTAVRVDVGEHRLCLARYNNTFYAVKDACPHSGAPLGKGFINHVGEVVCPLHHYRYRLLDGVEANEKSAAATTFPVELRNDGIFIGIEG